MECPYKRECATVMFWSEEKKDFIQEVCNTDEYEKCLHFFGSLDPQHKERERLYGDPHAHEPDWDEVARKGGRLFVPDVKVHCRKCGIPFTLPADHEDVAHPFPGPVCPMCEDDEMAEQQQMDSDEEENDA